MCLYVNSIGVEVDSDGVVSQQCTPAGNPNSAAVALQVPRRRGRGRQTDEERVLDRRTDREKETD